MQTASIEDSQANVKATINHIDMEAVGQNKAAEANPDLLTIRSKGQLPGAKDPAQHFTSFNNSVDEEKEDDPLMIIKDP